MTQPLPDALAQLVAQRWDKLTPRPDWTWGEWVRWLNMAEQKNFPLGAIQAGWAAFYQIFPPAECVMFPEEGA